MSDAPRPKQHLVAAGKLYPGAWKRVDHFREHKGKQYPDWPDWCFVPISATYGIVADDAGVDGSVLAYTHPDRVHDAARLAALATWRVTQGIYRFDPAIYESVANTPLERDLPCDVFYRLPEWCVYIETPGLSWMGQGNTLHGFWAHLEYDINTGRHELRLLLDSDDALAVMPIHLGDWPLLEALGRLKQEATRQAVRNDLSAAAASMKAAGLLCKVAEDVAPLLSLLLYVCSQSAEVGSGNRSPANPVPKRTKKGWRLFGAERTTQWDVGVRIGAALRRAYQAAELGEARATTEEGRSRPRAHVRRAHWHGFWKGPRDPERAADRTFSLKWMPPIPVNVDGDDLPATIRPIKE